MNVLFITLGRTIRIDEHGIYSDLMRKFHKEGHNLYIVYPLERKEGNPTTLVKEESVQYLGVRTLNLQKTNIIEKGIGTILVEPQFDHAIAKHFGGISFDLILYTTPPITFPNLIGRLKKRSPNAKTYLMLKDIFPQNAVDLGLFSKKSLFYKYFRAKEIKLYKNSDFIGCMSPANVKYIKHHNPTIDKSRIELCPNSLDLINNTNKTVKREDVLSGFGLPTSVPIVLYGGNLGKPQGIDYLVRALDENQERKDCFFLIVGDGTEYNKIEAWVQNTQPSNVKLIKRLPKSDYDKLASCCDIGLICLDHRFTIPNYPSRLLAYLENRMPVIVASDPNCDMGEIAQRNGFGFWCKSDDTMAFTRCLDKMLSSDIKTMGKTGYEFLCNNYLVDNSYSAIMKHLN